MFRDRSHNVFRSMPFVEIRKSMSLVAVYTPKEPLQFEAVYIIG